MELVSIVNLALCLAIVAMGVFGYTKSRQSIPLVLAMVFGLFAISHGLVILGLSEDLEMAVFAVRVVAYALVIYLLYRYIQILDVF